MTSTQAARTPHLSRRVRAVRVATAVTLTIGLAVAGAPPGTAAERSPTRQPAPASHTPIDERALTGGHREFFDVAAAAPDDVWAVGNGGAHLVTRAAHYDGHEWSPTDPPGEPLSELWGVTALSDGDVWAVGSENSVALALHRIDGIWVRVATPSPVGDELDRLQAIDAVGPDDIWAVGYTRRSETMLYKPLILHWDGHAWADVPYTLPYGNTEGSLDGVTVIAADDIWAVGDTRGDRGGDPLILHWDGTSWIPNADLLTVDSALFGLDDVDAAGPEDVWAVGAAHDVAAIIHWNGRTWTRVKQPKRSHAWLIDRLWGVHATAPDDVWAVGGRGDYAFPPEHITVLHWNGHRWSKVKTPNPGAKFNQLWDVDATGPNDVWAVGSYANDDTTTHHLILHYDGHRWTRSR